MQLGRTATAVAAGGVCIALQAQSDGSRQLLVQQPLDGLRMARLQLREDGQHKGGQLAAGGRIAAAQLSGGRSSSSTTQPGTNSVSVSSRHE